MALQTPPSTVPPKITLAALSPSRLKVICTRHGSTRCRPTLNNLLCTSCTLTQAWRPRQSPLALFQPSLAPRQTFWLPSFKLLLKSQMSEFCTDLTPTWGTIYAPSWIPFLPIQSNGLTKRSNPTCTHNTPVPPLRNFAITWRSSPVETASSTTCLETKLSKPSARTTTMTATSLLTWKCLVKCSKLPWKSHSTTKVSLEALPTF
mmetsp:Transcript_18576/g.46003  ORF Transcript_18576/g.46003 Transcript_18576/m.46003 type:complete len:205 (+) Transcript_18576:708-1322(+)